ncbi:hypothetical protein MBLNU230_g5305t1 [Neophaeotheca triangularis]
MNQGSGLFHIPLSTPAPTSTPTTPPRTHAIRIHETRGLTADNLPLSTWGSALVLANALPALPMPTPASSAPQLKLLELGAGTGLAGLAATARWKARAVLTDLPAMEAGVEANVRANGAGLAGLGAEARSGGLDWREPGVLRLEGGRRRVVAEVGGGEAAGEGWEAGFDVVVAADCCYDEAQPGLVVGVVEAWLRRASGSRVVFCYPLRVAYLDHIRDLWARMEGLGLRCRGDGRVEKEEYEGLGLDEEAPIEWCVWGWGEGVGE